MGITMWSGGYLGLACYTAGLVELQAPASDLPSNSRDREVGVLGVAAWPCPRLPNPQATEAVERGCELMAAEFGEVAGRWSRQPVEPEVGQHPLGVLEKLG